MKRVFLYAYDRINLGDDLFIHTITKRYPHVRFFLLSNKINKKTLREIKNLTVIDRESLFIKFLKGIRPSLVSRYLGWREKICNAVVYIGGSIFIEYDNWEQILTWWDYEAENRPFYVLGANFGPYTTEAYRDKLAEIFKNMKDVCFRDKYSLEKFSDVSLVRMAPDILFGYRMPISTTNKKQIFVSLIDCGSRKTGLERLEQYERRYLEFLSGMLNYYMQEGYVITFASFCSHEGDEIAIEKILCKMNIERENSQVNVLSYNGTNVQEILQEISVSEFVVASRFHASILGFVAEKPVLPVIYSDKTVHVLEGAGFEGLYADIRKHCTLDLGYLRDNIEKQKLQNIHVLQEQAQLHFYKLDRILR